MTKITINKITKGIPKINVFCPSSFVPGDHIVNVKKITNNIGIKKPKKASFILLIKFASFGKLGS